LQLASPHLPAIWKEHIFVLKSCIVAALSGFATFSFTANEDSEEFQFPLENKIEAKVSSTPNPG
jgi:hypothetical protein